jgi:hypothetical protein
MTDYVVVEKLVVGGGQQEKLKYKLVSTPLKLTH